MELELPHSQARGQDASIIYVERAREEKLRALKKVQLDADITRARGNLASVPVVYTATMENAIAQLERDLKELARK